MKQAERKIPELKAGIHFIDLQPPMVDIGEEVLAGLQSTPKHISPKYFYDRRGAELFEQITRLDEYYPTRTEISILRQYISDIVEIVERGRFLIEYGSGSSLKIRILLQELKPSAYMPVDISRQQLLENATILSKDFPGLPLYPTCADFRSPIQLPEAAANEETLAFFPGSSIGNFEPGAAIQFLRRVRKQVGPGGFFLLGVDRKKDTAILERAYNDSAGVTARFNRNILEHINSAIGAGFIPDQFRHIARYDEVNGCINMFLESICDQQVSVAGKVINFTTGERVHTESSYKYSLEGIIGMAQEAGLEITAQYSDSREYFSVLLFRAKD